MMVQRFGSGRQRRPRRLLTPADYGYLELDAASPPPADSPRRTLRPLALDLSLTSTGFATVDGCGVLVPPKESSRGLARLAWIRDRVLELARTADIVVLEGLAFGARGRATLDLAGLGAVVRLALSEAGAVCVDVPPATLKRFACGNGNADKAAMLVAAVRRLGYGGSDHNEADALWLLNAALVRYGCSSLDFPRTHVAALDVVDWPTPSGGAR